MIPAASSVKVFPVFFVTKWFRWMSSTFSFWSTHCVRLIACVEIHAHNGSRGGVPIATFPREAQWRSLSAFPTRRSRRRLSRQWSPLFTNRKSCRLIWLCIYPFFYSSFQTESCQLAFKGIDAFCPTRGMFFNHLVSYWTLTWYNNKYLFWVLFSCVCE